MDIKLKDNELQKEASPIATTTDIVEVEPKKTSITTVEAKKVEKTKKAPKPSIFDKMQLWQKILVITLLGGLTLAIIALGVWQFVFSRPISPTKIVAFDGSYIEPVEDSSDKSLIEQFFANIVEPNQPKTEPSPLNGVLFTKDDMKKMLTRRPVAIMTNNHIKARPQSGLSQADLVYEAVTESGITRYMAVYWSQLPNKAGPIRSARQYYLEWLSEFDPIYIHDGCASTSDPRTNACGNIYTYNIKDMRTIGAWRVSDRYAPHNEYTSAAYAVEYAKKVNWGGFNTGVDLLKYKRDAALDDRGAKTRVKIRFREDMANGGIYDSEWNYDKTTNLYYHKIGGNADYDLENKKPITAKVVVIQEVSLKDANDGHARVIITTTGEGKVVILQDGKIINGKWKKASRTDRTKFYDGTGKEIELNRGLMWITALPKEQGNFDIIEQ